MAIPNTPTNLFTQQANRQVFLLWDITPTATSYSVQRSVDGVTFTTIATPALNQYLDTTVTVGTQYFYQVAATNIDGTSAYTDSQNIIPTPTSEMSLQGIRLASQQKADRVNSNFVTLPEWNFYINQALTELYDLLVTAYEDYFLAPPTVFQTSGNVGFYPLPDGATSFLSSVGGGTFIAPPFYKLKGVDLAINNAQNAFVTLNKFNFIDRNKYVYPNSNSTIYGVFNLQYRVMGNQIEFIPFPTSAQYIQLWYVPRLPLLLKETDLTTIGYSGWLQYVIVRAAKYALDKEESDTSSLDQELVYMKQRIEESAQNRDEGRPDTISDTRSAFMGSGWGPIGNGSVGGF